ncbi:MAG: acyl--CoA ligase [Deltaproteobacteria bacterium]|nr:acyl--CoA ligase [Deltaproteobacteria bacterium]
MSALPGLRRLWARAIEGPAEGAIALVRPSGESFTYAQLADAVVRGAEQLRAAGVRERSAVAIAVADPLGALLAALSIWEAGAAVLPLELRGGAAFVEDAIVRAGVTRVVRDAWPSGELSIATREAPHKELDPRAGLLLFTSGSSGKPKCVVLGREGLAANVDAILRYLPIAQAPRTALTLPLTYSYALVGQALTTLRAGGTLILLGELAFPALQLEAMVRHGAHGLSSVPAALRLLAKAAHESRAAALPVPALRYVASAGAALEPAIAAQVHSAFPHATLFSQYGLTEASPRVAAISSEEPAFARGATGRALEGLDLWIEDDAGARVPAGAQGQIVVRGPSVMLGYLDDPEATQRALGADGGLRTGDLGHVDESGILFVHGRNDGVVKVAGERVGLDEIASALRTVQGAREIAIAAVPDEALGNRLIGFVECDSADVLGLVRKHARDTLPPQKRPAKLLQVPRIPRTANGKIDRAALQRLAQGES